MFEAIKLYKFLDIILWIIKTFITKIYNSDVNDNTYFCLSQSIISSQPGCIINT